MGTSSVVLATGIPIPGLSTGVQYLNAKGLGLGALQHLYIASIPLVGAYNRCGSPIRPVDVVFEHRYGEWMGEYFFVAQYYMMLGPVIHGT